VSKFEAHESKYRIVTKDIEKSKTADFGFKNNDSLVACDLVHMGVLVFLFVK
jgi:hypothetical protein